MSRVAIDIDDKACASVMRRFGLDSVEEAVNMALRMLSPTPMSLGEAQGMRGAGWVGDLDEMRAQRPMA